MVTGPCPAGTNDPGAGTCQPNPCLVACCTNGNCTLVASTTACNGTIISRQQFLIDINQWGYKDARLQPLGNMSADEITHWTAGIEKDGAK